MGQGKKDKNFYQVLSCALELDIKKGHLKWTLSDLSRKSKVTRSLIYYYFGRSKIGILNEAVRMIGDDILGLSQERMALWHSGNGLQSVLASRRLADEMPFLSTFYLSQRRQSTEIGEAMRGLEQAYVNKLRRLFPNKEESQIRFYYGILFGMIFSPVVDDEAIGHLQDLLKN